MGIIALGNLGGKIASGGQVIRNVDTTTTALNFNFAWTVSVTNQSNEFKRLISEGYSVNLHYVRCISGGSKTHFNRLAKLSPDGRIYTRWKMSNFSINITSQILANSTSIVITDWLNSRFVVNESLKEFRTKALELYYTDYGYFFRRFKLAIVINNVIYGETDEIFVYYHCSPGDIGLIDFSATEIDGTDIHLFL